MTALTLVEPSTLPEYDRWQSLDRVLDLLEAARADERAWPVRRLLARAIDATLDAAGEMTTAYPALKDRLALEHPDIWGDDDDEGRQQ